MQQCPTSLTIRNHVNRCTYGHFVAHAVNRVGLLCTLQRSKLNVSHNQLANTRPNCSILIQSSPFPWPKSSAHLKVRLLMRAFLTAGRASSSANRWVAQLISTASPSGHCNNSGTGPKSSSDQVMLCEVIHAHVVPVRQWLMRAKFMKNALLIPSQWALINNKQSPSGLFTRRSVVRPGRGYNWPSWCPIMKRRPIIRRANWTSSLKKLRLPRTM